MFSPIKRHGGKTPLAPRIVKLMPPHAIYCEPYFGGGSVYFAKPPVSVEVVADIDPDLMTFWKTLAADHDGGFRRFVRQFPYDESTFEWAGQLPRSPAFVNPRLHAFAFLVVNRMSRSALGKDFAWSDRLRRGMPEQLSSWGTMLDSLDLAYNRLKSAAVDCSRAPDVIRSADSTETLFYLDPPYPHDTRTVADAYSYEMSTKDHLDLLRLLVDDVRGKVMISTYPNPLYDQWLGGAGWELVEWKVRNHAGQGKVKAERVEQVWANFELGGGVR